MVQTTMFTSTYIGHKSNTIIRFSKYPYFFIPYIYTLNHEPSLGVSPPSHMTLEYFYFFLHDHLFSGSLEKAKILQTNVVYAWFLLQNLLILTFDHAGSCSRGRSGKG